MARPFFSRLMVLATALAVGAAAAPASAQSLDNKGDEFLLMFLENAQRSSNIEVHLTSDVPTMATVEYPVNAPSFSQTVAVNPGDVTVVVVPSTAGSGWTAGAVADNAVSVAADDEVVAYMINRSSATTDAALGLPVDTMNNEYIVAGITGTSLHTIDQGEFGVVAGFDNTTVTITPTNDLLGGFGAGVPFNVMLNRGEGFFAQSVAIQGAAADLTGTTVSSDRPVGVTNGMACANIPPNVAACDHIFEVAQPVQTWGLRAVVANLPNRTGGTIYRVLASEDNTTVDLDGALLGVINRGDFIETTSLTGDHEFEADKPIYVVQYMTGDASAGATNGDPAMGNMIPPEQYLSDYTFSTVGGSQFVQNFLTVIASNADAANDSVLLDGVAIPAMDFSPIGTSGFSSAIVELTQGTHNTSSPSPHGITVEGYNSADSYIYPGGALFEFINPMGDPFPPICSLTPTNGTVDGTATDNSNDEDTNGNGLLDEGEDTNGNGVLDADTGIFFVTLLGSSNMNLMVDPFVPGDPLATFELSPADSTFLAVATLRATDGAGNTCREVVQIGDFDTGGEFVRTGPRSSRLRIRRPGPDTEGVRCVETANPEDPDFGDLPFTPFPNGEVELEVEVSEGNTTVCCQFIDNQEQLSAPACQDLAGAGSEDVCDVDGDGDVDVDDVDAIFAARGEQATGPDDPRDSNGDGIISVNDGRECVLQCDLENCERPQPMPSCGLLGIEPFLLLGYPLWRRRRRGSR